MDAHGWVGDGEYDVGYIVCAATFLEDGVDVAARFSRPTGALQETTVGLCSGTACATLGQFPSNHR